MANRRDISECAIWNSSVVGLRDIMKAYDTFGNAAQERALKVILTN